MEAVAVICPDKKPIKRQADSHIHLISGILIDPVITADPGK